MTRAGKSIVGNSLGAEISFSGGVSGALGGTGAGLGAGGATAMGGGGGGIGGLRFTGEAALASAPSAGTSTTALHLGQRAFFPAAAALTRMDAEHAVQRH